MLFDPATLLLQSRAVFPRIPTVVYQPLTPPHGHPRHTLSVCSGARLAALVFRRSIMSSSCATHGCPFPTGPSSTFTTQSPSTTGSADSSPASTTSTSGSNTTNSSDTTTTSTSDITTTSTSSPTTTSSSVTSPTSSSVTSVTSTSTTTDPGTTALPSAANQVSSSGSSSSSDTGAIIGGVVGGVIFLLCVALGLFLYMRRRRRKRIAPSSEFINSLRPGVAPVFMLESSPAQVPEKSMHSHYLASTPYQQDAYYASPSPSSMDFPDSAVSTDRSPGSQKMEKPLVPNRYSAQRAAASSHSGHVDADDRQSTGSREWDGDPVIETPRHTRSRRPESAPASAPRSSSSHHQWSHHQQQLPAQNFIPRRIAVGCVTTTDIWVRSFHTPRRFCFTPYTTSSHVFTSPTP
ncbi:hypothetical protein F5141DRAFT_822140 [Pisolithus sp. B1]|nr:hypothetical protein F5141DRAFT_822140 [Pisolithus sp. B1]